MEYSNNSSRTLNSESGLLFNLKYIANPKELSWYNKQEYSKKECDYCGMIEAHKESTHSLIKTELSLFEGHELLVAPTHGGEYIGEHLKHMLNLVNENKNSAIAFEGSRNAPIKKYHFACHYISDKNQLPITTDVNKQVYKRVIDQDKLSIGILDVYGRNPIVIKSTEYNHIIDAFYEIENKIGVDFSTNNHPYINFIIWKEDEQYVLAAIPRVVYKPTEYYNENNPWDIAPGVLEMSGIYLISNHDEYLHMTAEELLKITDEVSYNDTHLLEVLKKLDLSKIN